ncbi:Isopenicillin N synthase [Geosmithia morbida]|uniref:Isopenicillin N synthase n=1 Tax=Geosmithia morbida TaxID=1094350 RepID=A0A9P4YSK2_9HYPO|nr:Isopenicillin N synthase [Geosmithia morbida]KAF4121014.1 Isopenicillin N synthase [Geosmithia morbida]
MTVNTPKQSDVSIPVIDFAKFDCGSPEDDQAIGKAMYEAFRDHGFAYIANHGIPQGVVDEAFEWNRKFFDLPQAIKGKAPHPPVGWWHRGYSGIGREKVVQMVFDEASISELRKIPDFKESYEIGRDDDPHTKTPNIWIPEDDLPGFRAFFTSFFEEGYRLELLLLRAVAIGMGLPSDYFWNFHQAKNNQIRLLHYPPVQESLLRDGKTERIASHTDFGTLTLLFQDDVGGLEVEDIHERGKFNPAPYIPGTVVVNIGDFLMRWSNDHLKSTLHRVRAPPLVDNDELSSSATEKVTRARRSIPYFVTADPERIIDCLPGCYGPDNPKKYEPITAGEYVDMRLNATY